MNLNNKITLMFVDEICWLHGQFSLCIWLCRGRFSEKVHATIPKGIVGGFAFTQVLQGNLNEWHERP